jgi:DNA-binding CsgD family transcriptional regulator
MHELLHAVRLEAVRGRHERCREKAITAFELAVPELRESLCLSLGLLELGGGDPHAALAHLAHAAPGPEYVETLVRVGRRADARAALEQLSASTPAERAAAARCRGLLDDDFEEHFAQALVWHALAPDEFETARTLLCFGERLRRARRRRESRPPLRAALEAFERLDARGWAARAREELGASGQTIRPRASWDEETLTAQEQRIAALAASGATNREVAAHMFLSPKTVETHLSRVYRKLDVRSRTELAGRMGVGATPARAA